VRSGPSARGSSRLVPVPVVDRSRCTGRHVPDRTWGAEQRQATTIQECHGEPIGGSEPDRRGAALALVYCSTTTGSNLAVLQVQQTRTTAGHRRPEPTRSIDGTMINATPREAGIATCSTTRKKPAGCRPGALARSYSKFRALDEYNTLMSDAYRPQPGDSEKTDAAMGPRRSALRPDGPGRGLMPRNSAIIYSDLAAAVVPTPNSQCSPRWLARAGRSKQTMPACSQYRAY